MATLPNAVIDLSQTILSFIALGQLVVPTLANRLEERLNQGDSFETILAEMAPSAEGNSDSRGFSSLILAIYHLTTDQQQAALDDCEQALESWPEGSPIINFLKAHVLTSCGRYDDAFAAFSESHEWLWFLFGSLEETPNFASYIGQQKEEFYQRWTLPGLMQGLEGLAYLNSNELQRGGEKVVAVLRRAKDDGLEDSVWSVIHQVEEALPPEIQDQMHVLRDFIQLIAIEDPFEGLKALAKNITAIWPKDVDCVDAVRDQRR